jgi:hypothetical protein
MKRNAWFDALEDKKNRDDRRARQRKGSTQIRIGGSTRDGRFNEDEIIHDPDEYFDRLKRKRDQSAKSNKSGTRSKSASKSVIEENKEYENDSWDSDFD